jgi:hypothetical protein
LSSSLVVVIYASHFYLIVLHDLFSNLKIRELNLDIEKQIVISLGKKEDIHFHRHNLFKESDYIRKLYLVFSGECLFRQGAPLN